MRPPAREQPSPPAGATGAFRLAFLLLPTVLGACASTSGEVRATAPVLPAAWSAAAEAPPGPPVDPTAWWARFEDPLLDDLVASALAGNLGLAQAAQRIAAARALVTAEDARFRPGLAAAAAAEGQRRLAGDLPDAGGAFAQPRGVLTWRTGLDASWEVGLFGRAGEAGRAARAAAAATEEEEAAARISLAAEVARTYLELRAHGRRAALLRASADGQRRLLAFTEGRRRVGLANDLDVERAASTLRQTEASLPQAEAAARRAARRLATLAGRAEPEPRLMAVLDQPQPMARGLVTMGVPADLLRARPDIRRAELAVVQAAAELGVARADLWPRLTLGGGLTLTGTAVGASLLSPAGPILSAVGGPSLSLPLFDWGARRAAVEARGARLAEAALAYRQSVLEAAEEVEDALASLAAERARAERLELAEGAAARALGNARALFRQGLVSSLDVITAELDLARTGLELASAREGEALAAVALHRALGGGVLPAASTPILETRR